MSRAGQTVTGGVSGLLFGQVQPELVVIQACRPLSEFADTKERSGTNAAAEDWYQRIVTRSKGDPELAGFTLVGWYSTRRVGGLEAEDLEFHAKNFRKPYEIALIVPNNEDGELTLELYCGNVDGGLSSEGHRWGTARISANDALGSPLEISMRSKIQDDFYMRAYDLSGEEEEEQQQESGGGWREALSNTKKLLARFKLGKPEDGNGSPFPNALAHEFQHQDLHADSLHPISHASGGGAAGTAAARAKIQSPRPDTAQRTADGGPVVRRLNLEELQAMDRLKQEALLASSSRPSAYRGFDGPALANDAGRPTLGSSLPARASTNALAPDARPAFPDTGSSPVVTRVPQYATPVRDRMHWLTLGAVFALAAAATFGLIYLRTAHANGSLPGILGAIWPSPGLGLKLTNSGDRLQLSWNEGAPAVREASDAILEISDGADHRQVRLTSREVANGSVLYRPNTEDVAFRLEVHGRDGQVLSETMRVLGDLKPATLDVSRPQTRPEDTATRKPSSTTPGTGEGQLQLDAKTPIDPSRLVAVRPRRERPLTEVARPVASGATDTSKVSGPAVSPSSSPAPRSISPPPNTPVQGTDVAQPSAALADSVLPNLAPSNPNLSRAPKSETDKVAQNVTPPRAVPARDVPPVSPAPQPARPDTNAGQSPDVSKAPQPSKQALPSPSPTSNNTVGSAPAQLPPGQMNKATPGSLAAYQPPRPVKQILPNLKALPAGMADATGDVRVLLKVNESGHVVDARVIEDNKKVSSLVKTAAIMAAKQWVFQPATLRGQSIASEHTILFQFHH